MKRFIIFILVLLAGTTAANAQYNRFDGDINSIRNGSLADFRFHYDDYIQYSPAGLMMAMKVCGYESRSSWPRMLVSDAFSTALMAATVNGLKYTVQRPRPDGSQNNSFPSGHTATAFMSATMLHKEYGWRSPWFSIGGYTLAAATGVSRILNNKHWMTDIAAGAAVGIGAVHLGYYLTDLIFKEKHLYDGYEKPCFFYDPSVKHYSAELIFGRRFIIGASGAWQPIRGGLAGVSADIPMIPGLGITGRVSANSLTYPDSIVGCLYSALAGGFYNFHFAKILELQAKVMAGYAWGEKIGAGASLGAGFSLSMITGNNFKIKAFAELESMDLDRTQPLLNTVIVGFSTVWFW